MTDATDTWEKEISTLPEAPASANIKFWIKGYGVMLTMRGTEVSDIMNKINTIVTLAIEKDWKPTWDKETPPGVTSAPTQDLGVCAKCGAPNKLSSKGKPYCSKVCWKV